MRVSVIIPVHNAEPFLPTCIESIQRQTIVDFEVLLVENGSSDRSGAICDRYAEQDPRLRVFHTPGNGVSAARNLGLDNARGTFVAFVDADDWVTPDHLEQLLESGIGEDEIAFANLFHLRPNGKETIAPMPQCDVSGSPETCMRVFARLLRARCFGWTCNKLFSRATIERTGLRFDTRIHYAEDEIFTARYCRNVTRVVCNSRPTYYYRYVATSLLHKPKDPIEFLRNWQFIRRQYVELGYNDEMLYLTSRTLFSRIRRELRKCDGWRSEASDLLAQELIDNWKFSRKHTRPSFRKGFYDWKTGFIGWLACAPGFAAWTKFVVKGLHL